VHLLHLVAVSEAQTLFKADIQVQGQLVLLVHAVQDHYLLLELRVLGVVVLKDRSKGSTGEREGDDTHQHSYNTENLFEGSTDVHITVSYCCDSCNSEVEGGEVLLRWSQLICSVSHPRLSAFILELNCEHPEAADDMAHYEERENEDYQSFKPNANFEDFLHILD